MKQKIKWRKHKPSAKFESNTQESIKSKESNTQESIQTKCDEKTAKLKLDKSTNKYFFFKKEKKSNRK